MLQDYDTSFSRVYFSPARLFPSLLSSPPFRPFSPPSVPDPFLYISSLVRPVASFFKKRSIMSRKEQRSAFDQVSEFDRGRIVA
ncbi:hypothetical protein TNCV_3174271 [Trichonephila clavipes]|nr:hypothetical protein TNCV_3174271 [Trichonephila clavipes]